MMRKIILLLFIVLQVYSIVGLKCYKCKDDCASPTEEECPATAKCCFSSDKPLEEAAAPAERRKRSAEEEHTLRGSFRRFFEDKHKEKGCCTEKTEEKCKDPCYTCKDDLCNKEDKAGSLNLMTNPFLIISAIVLISAAI